MENRCADDRPVRPPVWAAALLAAGNGFVNAAVPHRIEWEAGRACLRFTNQGRRSLILPELGIKLAGGCILDVRWPAGATAYEFAIKKGPRKARSGARAASLAA